MRNKALNNLLQLYVYGLSISKMLFLPVWLEIGRCWMVYLFPASVTNWTQIIFNFMLEIRLLMNIISDYSSEIQLMHVTAIIMLLSAATIRNFTQP